MALNRRGNKYNAKGCYRNGQWCDSRMEADYCDVLELLKRAGKIKEYRHHPPSVHLLGRTRWNVDFLVTHLDGTEFYVEVKGFETRDYKIKLDLWRELKPAPLFVVKGKGTRFYVTDEIATEDLRVKLAV